MLLTALLATASVSAATTAEDQATLAHQATLDRASPHYADQLPLFVEKKTKPVWFTKAQLTGISSAITGRDNSRLTNCSRSSMLMTSRTACPAWVYSPTGLYASGWGAMCWTFRALPSPL